MTQVVSSSFCRYAQTAEPLAALDEFKARCEVDGDELWSNPVLQIIDIQKFVDDPDPLQPSRFYIVLSDAEECIWAIVPVRSKLEGAIACGDVEVGCLLTLVDYAIVAAKCAKNVIIVLDSSFSTTSVSMIGAPRINAALVQLSSQSLLHRNTHVPMQQKSSALSLFTERQVKDFLPEDGGVVFMDPQERWSIVGRILWRSKLRRVADLQNSFGTASQQQQQQSTQQRTAFDCVIVDHNGDGIKAVFWGLRSAYDVCEPGRCVRVAHGTVKRDPKTSMPIALHFQDKSLVDDLGDGDESLPCRAVNLVGACAVPFEEVARVLERNAVGDIISVHGVVHHVYPCTSVRTRNGMVDKVTLTLKDRVSPQTIDITLWNDAARDCEPLMGQTWCFRDVVVRMFGNAKQLSSRASSEIFIEPSNASGERYHPTSYYPLKQSKEASHPPPGPPQHQSTVPSLNFVFSLHEVKSEAQFVLVKIQRIKFPLFYLSCKTCGAQMRGMMCLNCSSSQSELRFLVRMELSDGIHGIQEAVGFTVVGESLFGETTAEFAASSERDGNYVKRCVDEIIGLPVLVKIIRSPEGVCHVSELKHVALAPACRALCRAIDEYLLDDS